MMTFGVQRSAFSVSRVPPSHSRTRARTGKYPFLWTSAKHGSQTPNAERRTPNAEPS